MKPKEALRAVQDLASSQWGLLTTPQARGLGVTAAQMARFAEQGSLERLQHGVYAVAGVPFDPQRELQAAWLALDSKVPASERIDNPDVELVSHASAADLHSLGDIEADVFEFTARRRKQSRRDDVRIHRGLVPKADWTQASGLPVTTPARTVQDLAAAGIDGGHLALVARDAITKAGVSMEQLGRRLAPYAAKYGAAGDGQSLLARFLDEAGIPEASAQLADHQVKGIIERLAGTVARQVTLPLSAPDSDLMTQIQQIAGLHTPSEILTKAITDQMGKTIADIVARNTRSTPTGMVSLPQLSQTASATQPATGNPEDHDDEHHDTDHSDEHRPQ